MSQKKWPLVRPETADLKNCQTRGKTFGQHWNLQTNIASIRSPTSQFPIIACSCGEVPAPQSPRSVAAQQKRRVCSAGGVVTAPTILSFGCKIWVGELQKCLLAFMLWCPICGFSLPAWETLLKSIRVLVKFDVVLNFSVDVTSRFLQNFILKLPWTIIKDNKMNILWFLG